MKPGSVTIQHYGSCPLNYLTKSVTLDQHKSDITSEDPHVGRFMNAVQRALPCVEHITFAGDWVAMDKYVYHVLVQIKCVTHADQVKAFFAVRWQSIPDIWL